MSPSVTWNARYLRCGGAALLVSALGCGGGTSHRDASPTPESSPQGGAIGETLRELSGSPGSPGALPVRIYYPAARAGTDVPVGSGSYPLIVFSHGYQQSFADYAYVWRQLVPAGYVVALPDRLSGSVTIAIDAYAADIAFVLAELRRLSAAGDPVLGGHLTATSALMGHSTGGGASVMAQASQRRAAATWQAATLVLLAPLGQTFGPIGGTDPPDVAGDAGVPVLTLAGGRDCICPVAQHAGAIHQALGAAATKYLVTVNTGDHCGFSDEGGPGRTRCELAEAAACLLGQGSTLSPAEQNALAAELLRPWLARWLKNDATAWATFRSRADDARLTVEGHDAP